MPRNRPTARVNTGLYGQTLDYLGTRIVDGVIPVGGKVYVDQLCEDLGISRSVVREVVRTLSSMGILESRPQLGTRVLPQANWDFLNPYVVRWRAQGPDYLLQMEQLLELRYGVEPAAAALSATRMSAEDAAELVHYAHKMVEMMTEGRVREYFDWDAAFHRLILEGTGNQVIAQLSNSITETLNARGSDHRPEMLNLTKGAMDLHLELAHAIQSGDPDAARTAAEQLVSYTMNEFSSSRGDDLALTGTAPQA